MAKKLQVRALPRKAHRTEERTFQGTDAEGKPVEVTLCCEVPTPFRLAELSEAAEAEWTTGYKGRPFPMPDSEGQEEVHLTWALFRALKFAEKLQVGPSEERYTLPELVVLVERVPAVWVQVNAWTSDLIAEATGQGAPAGNAAGAAGTSSPAPPPATTSPTST